MNATAPEIQQPNIFPLDWPKSAPITYELFDLAKKQSWDPATLPWEDLREARLAPEERLGIGYWFSLLGVFDASAPPCLGFALKEYKIVSVGASKFNAIVVMLCLCVGIFLGVSGYTFHYAKGTSYLSNNPKSCVNCHVMQDQYDSWQKSSHHALASCNDCHVPREVIPKWFAKLENGYHHSKAFTLQDFHEPIRIKPKNSAILQKNCVICHVDIVSGLAGFHKETDLSMSCVKCHADVGHGARN